MKHTPVLENEIADQFKYLRHSGKYFVDGTLGMAGHSIRISKDNLSNSEMKFIGLDQDEKALKEAKENIKQAGLDNNFILVHTNFSNINNVLSEQKIYSIDGALLDLGVSSMQLDDKSRGFSFSDRNQKLDMRMDQDQELDAKTLLNTYSSSEISKIIYEFGEEKHAGRIAKNITDFRKAKKIETAGDLLDILERSIPKREQFGKHHNFATKTFQAIRIAVNSELEILEKSIRDFADKLNPDAKLAIITFHSLEDRIVKNTFNDLANPCKCPAKLPCVCGLKPSVKILTKKPIIPSPEEVESNPRSRSAKLRAIEKI